MVSLIKKFTGLLMIIGTIATTVAFANVGPTHFNDVPSVVDNYPYITESLLSSSRYTQPTNIDPARLQNYEDNFKPDFSKEDLETINYEFVLENDHFELYFNDLSFGIMLRNKDTGYLWSSMNLFYVASDGNRTFRNHGNSGIWVDFVRTTAIRSSAIIRESILSIADARYYQENDDIPDDLLVYAINPNATDSKHNDAKITYTVNSSTNKLIAHINLRPYKFEFDVEISLTDKGFDTFLNKDSIEENDDRFRLLNIHLFPNFGATKETNVPGYFMIPDGIGALVRLDRNHNTTFNARFYGNDAGYNQNYRPNLTLPIFGVTHLEGENAFYAYVKEGAEHANLQGTFAGANTKFNSMHIQYSVRNIYYAVISRDGSGAEAILPGYLNGNLDISYRFLSGEDASYVGMAKDFQETLVDTGILSEREKINQNQIPLQTSYIMTEREASFIGTNKVVMSSIDQIKEMYHHFKENEILNQQVTLYGWSEDGFTDRAPYRQILVENVNQFRSLGETLKGDGNGYYMHQDYRFATSKGPRINYFSDVAYNITRIRMSNDISGLDNLVYQRYDLFPWSSLRMANEDKSGFDYYLTDGIALDGITYSPFGFSNSGQYYDRTDSISYYQDIASLYPNSQMYQPSFYLYKALGSYLDMTIGNSQFTYYSDLVPMLPLVLKGYISYFTSYLNFNALGKDRILNLIDFGMNPSFVLTYEETYKMRFTDASNFYTTSFSNYKEEVVETYHYVNDALKHVLGEKIVARDVLALGIVRITYSNNKKIYVNYSNTNYSVDGITINAQDYEVV